MKSVQVLPLILEKRLLELENKNVLISLGLEGVVRNGGGSVFLFEGSFDRLWQVSRWRISDLNFVLEQFAEVDLRLGFVLIAQPGAYLEREGYLQLLHFIQSHFKRSLQILRQLYCKRNHHVVESFWMHTY